MNKMKPIIFNTEMVRAILSDRKTMTRRVMKPQPRMVYYDGYLKDSGEDMRNGSPLYVLIAEDQNGRLEQIVPPYQPGNILYVRETFWKCIDGECLYKADFSEPEKRLWRPSIHMPREAARIFLRVTDVRVERLRDMLPCDIQREGCPYTYSGFDEEQAPDWYGWIKKVWDSTIKPADIARYGWDANPFVWCISFEKISKKDAYRNAH